SAGVSVYWPSPPSLGLGAAAAPSPAPAAGPPRPPPPPAPPPPAPRPPPRRPPPRPPPPAGPPPATGARPPGRRPGASPRAATGAFTLAGLASIIYLIKESRVRKDKVRPGGYLDRVPSLPALDRVAYRVTAFAFPVWTFGVLIAGPIWAENAWGRYWGWDPKE